MNHLLSFLPADGWQRLLCDALWQSSLIGTAGLLVARFMLRHAAAKSWVLLLTISACAVTPLVSLAARAQGWTVLAAEKNGADSLPAVGNFEVVENLAAGQAQGLQLPGLERDVAVDVESHVAIVEVVSPAPAEIFENVPAAKVVDRGASSVPSHFAVLAVVWLFLSAMLLVRFALSLLATRRLLRAAKLCDDADLLAAAENAARRVELRKTVRLLCSERVSTPMVLAFGAPRLLVPASYIVRPSWSEQIGAKSLSEVGTAVGNLTTSDQDGRTICVDWTAAFTHELAHVVRGDGWSRLWAEFVSIALPLSPLVWVVKHALRNACEEACDDWVIATGTDPADFAATLTTWIKTPHQKTPLPAIGISGTKSRLVRILSIKDKPMTRLRGISRYAALPVVLLLTAAKTEARDNGQKSASPTTAPPQTDLPVSDYKEPLKASQAEKVEQALESILMQDPAFVKLHSDFSAAAEALDALRAVSKQGQNASTIAKFEAKVQQLQPKVEARIDLERQKLKQNGQKLSSAVGSQSTQPEFADDSLMQVYRQQIEKAEEQLIRNSKSIRSFTLGIPNKEPSFELQQSQSQIQERLDSLRGRLENRAAESRAREIGDDARLDAPLKGGREADRSQPYIIEPPDILLIDPIQLTPRDSVRVVPNDKVRIEASGTYADRPIHGDFTVDSAGEVVLGPRYGTVRIKGLTRREAQAAIETHLEEILVHPEVALTIDESRLRAGIGGEHLVCPDGTVNLGVYGSAYISGMTVAQARAAIQTQLESSFVSPKIAIEVKAFNSKVYYIISEGGGAGDNIQRFPITGKETILDAIANIGGLSRIASKQIWIARPTSGGDKILPVKWDDVVHGKDNSTNYRILHGDRIFIAADKDAVRRELEERKNNPPQKIPEGQETF